MFQHYEDAWQWRTRFESDWNRTTGNFGQMKTESDWENFCCFIVIMLTISKFLVAIRLYLLINYVYAKKGPVYFASWGKSINGAISP